MRFNLEKLGLPLALETCWRNGKVAPMLRDPVDGAILAAEAFAEADAVYAGSALAAGELGGGALELGGAAVAGDAAAGAVAGDVVAGTAGNVAGDLASSTSALNPAADTVAGSGPGVTSSAATTPGATDTATNVATKMNAVTPDTVLEGGVGPSTSGAGAPGVQKPGLIDSVMNWATKNPTLAAGALQTVGGAAAGAGKAAVERGTMERKAELDKQKQIELAQWQDTFNHGAAAGPFSITPGSTTLRRSDGTPVYAAGSGLINRARV